MNSLIFKSKEFQSAIFELEFAFEILGGGARMWLCWNVNAKMKKFLDNRMEDFDWKFYARLDYSQNTRNFHNFETISSFLATSAKYLNKFLKCM